MNRTVIIVRDPRPATGYRYGLITLHWEYGPKVENWLAGTFPDHRSAWSLIESGHRSTITESRLDTGAVNHCEYENHRTLKAAKASWEHYTLAYYNGKRWVFERSGDGD